MNDTTIAAPMTVRAFLFDDGSGGDTAEIIGRSLAEHGVAKSALSGVRRLSTGAVQSVDREVGSVVDGLLALDLGDIIVSCWRKHQALVEAANHTLAAPGTEEVVALATHRVTGTYSPQVDLLVDGAKVTTLDFKLVVTIDATGLAAVVKSGRLVALHGGECLASATLSLEGAPLATRQKRVEPGVMVSLGRGVALVDQAATTPVIPQQKAGQDLTAETSG